MSNIKGDLDNFPTEIILQIIEKYYNNIDNISDINKFCKSTNKIRSICCTNKTYISKNMLKNKGITKGITNENADFFVRFLQKPKIGSSVFIYKIFHLPFIQGQILDLSLLKLLLLNNKIGVDDYEIYHKSYPFIYKYTTNNQIKNLILQYFDGNPRISPMSYNLSPFIIEEIAFIRFKDENRITHDIFKDFVDLIMPVYLEEDPYLKLIPDN